jgi:hypothetical protein
MSSQKGRPIAANATESTVATSAMSRSCPRTYAPSLRSMRSQVLLTVSRWERGMSDVTSRTASSRSKIQYAAEAKTKKIASAISKPRTVSSSAGSNRSLP